MKYLFRVFLVSAFLLSMTTDVVYAKKAAKKAPKKVAESKGPKGSFTYLSVAKDLKKMKKKLTTIESKVVNDFIKGKAKNYKDAKHLESAIKKHSCFVSNTRKKTNLLAIPSANQKPDWFTLDCSKPGNKPAGKGKGGKKPSGPGSAK